MRGKNNVVELFPDEGQCRICREKLLLEDGNGLLCLRVLNGTVDSFVASCKSCGAGYSGGPKRPMTAAGILEIAQDYALLPSVRMRLEKLGLPALPEPASQGAREEAVPGKRRGRPPRKPLEPVRTKTERLIVRDIPLGRPRKDAKRVKTVPLMIRVTPKQFQTLKKLAKVSGHKVAHIIRELIEEGTE